MTEPPTLIVMAKAPLLGLGKTRLAADIGAAEALRVNRLLQRRVLRQAYDPRWRTLLCVTPDDATALALPGVWPAASLDAPRAPQGEGDLGQRMARAFARRRSAAVIGVDCPDITRTHIAAAFVALTQAPFALGPTRDGGFWILAARDGSAAAAAMAGVRWSSAHAAADVLDNLGRENTTLLAELEDVDTLADLRRWRQRCAKRPSSGV